MDLGVLEVDLVQELELQMVGLLQRIALALKGQAGGLQVQLRVFWLAVRDGDGEVDVVLLGVGG